MKVKPIHNVVIAGETGVGKSSLISLITGVERAATANNTWGIIDGTEYHNWVTDTHAFRLWDTPGLSDSSLGAISPESAQDALRSLLTELYRGGGVHLVVICMRGLPIVTRGMKHTYDTIVRIRDKIAPDIPLVAVITGLEKTSALPHIIPSMDEWWTRNVGALSKSRMTFSGHACIATLPDDCHPKSDGRRELCQRLVRYLIIEGVSPELVYNIVIAGEIRVGKSSLVNLVLGLERAVVSNDASPVTIATSSYDWDHSGQVFRLWDTPGLVEGSRGKCAQEALQSLFADLGQRGGVHLLIVCVRAFSRSMMATKRTYDLIIKIRNNHSPATPVVVVVTDLEFGPTGFSTKEWWSINFSKAFSSYGMAISGYACMTILPGDSHSWLPERRESCQESIHNLITNKYPPPPNVVFIGEIGSGKSSVINLIAGHDSAVVSNNATPCTTEFAAHDVLIRGRLYRLWDTLGLNQPSGFVFFSRRGAPTREAIRRFLRERYHHMELDLLVLCVRGSRAHEITNKAYRVFCRATRQFAIPVVIVITHREREQPTMDTWWKKNEEILRNLEFDGHACITSLSNNHRTWASQEEIRDLISREYRQRFRSGLSDREYLDDYGSCTIRMRCIPFLSLQARKVKGCLQVHLYFWFGPLNSGGIHVSQSLLTH